MRWAARLRASTCAVYTLAKEAARIGRLLADRSAAERRELLVGAADRACDALGLRGSDEEAVRELVRWAAADLVPRLDNALRHGSLDGVFVL